MKSCNKIINIWIFFFLESNSISESILQKVISRNTLSCETNSTTESIVRWYEETVFLNSKDINESILFDLG